VPSREEALRRTPAALAADTDAPGDPLSRAAYRSVLDENLALVALLRTAHAELQEVGGHLASVSALSARQQEQLEGVVAVLQHKDTRLRLRKGRIAVLQGEVAALSEERRGLLVVAHERALRVDELRLRCGSLVERNQRLFRDLAAESQDKESAAEQVARARQELRSRRLLESEFAVLQEQLQATKLELLDVRTRHDKLTRAHAQLEHESAAQVDNLNRELGHRRRELMARAEDLAALQEQYAQALQEIESLRSELARLRREQVELSSSAADSAALRTRLESDLEDLRQRHEEESARAEELRREARRREAENAELQASARAREEELTRLRRELVEAREARRDAQQEARKCRGESQRAQESSSSLKAELEAKTVQYDGLKAQHASASALLAEYKRMTARLQAELAEQDRLKAAYAFSTTELQRLSLKLRELKASSEAQVVSLTDSRGRYLQQTELLRAKNGALGKTLEQQKAELRRVTLRAEAAEEELQAARGERDSARLRAGGEAVRGAEAERAAAVEEAARLRARVVELEQRERERAKEQEAAAAAAREKAREEKQRSKEEPRRVTAEGLDRGLGLLEMPETDELRFAPPSPGRLRAAEQEQARLRTEVGTLRGRVQAQDQLLVGRAAELARRERESLAAQDKAATLAAELAEARAAGEARVAAMHKQVAELEAIVSQYRERGLQGIF
jgi:chromosome segregation ATPase